MNRSEASGESIAIIGLAGRFPRAENLREFWRHLREGREMVSFFGDDEVEWSRFDGPPESRSNVVKARAVLERAEWFDAGFFGVTPREAESTDPQHRVLLECAWEALENAGVDPGTFDGLIGVFAGASMNTYLLNNILAPGAAVTPPGGLQLMLAGEKDFLTTRISYKLNLRGPSLNIQTACSTSLVAVAVACQNLLSYQCDLALAGGVSITFPQKKGQQHQEGAIVSPDGHCRAFDARAAGTVGGDGAGLVVLKRLPEALADGDHIHAIIRGTAVNNDGALKGGYTAPSSDGQAEVIALAQAAAGVEPDTISYIEAHGTATPIGDPIEVAGLTKAFGGRTRARHFCALGSVKSNLGHLDAAAGIAGLIKTVLALQQGELPPTLHFERPNPKIDFDHSPFFVNGTLRAWPRGAVPRRAGVSSFGIGGTNAHVVLEEAPLPPASGASRPWQLLLLSAKTPTALEAATRNLVAHLRENPEANLADVAYTLQTGRRPMRHRRMVVCQSVADAIQALESGDTARVFTGETSGSGTPVAFMFPGQGAQRVNLGRELYAIERDFRAEIDACCEAMKPRLRLDLREVMFPATECTEEAAARLGQTMLTQPALFTIEFALARLWQSWGIRPQAMLGHSLGEYVAACLAGVLSRDDALALVVERARLMQKQPPGAMLAVRLPEQELVAQLGPGLSLAAVNAPNLGVASGPVDAIAALEQRLALRGAAGRRLPTSHAFHSAMMEPVMPRFAETVRGFRLQPPQIPWVSNVTGRWITPQEAGDPNYWAAHLRHTVRFADGVGRLAAGECRAALEVGPGQTLATLARQHPATAAGAVAVVASLGKTGKNDSECASLLHALGRLWIAGVAVDWRGFYAHEQRRRMPLPTYPFERKRYWIDPAGATAETTPAGKSEATEPAPAGGDGIVAELRKIFGGLSGIDLSSESATASFFELGFDSLFLTQASLAVQRRFGVEVSFRQLREELVTLEKLAARLEQRPAMAGTTGGGTTAITSRPDSAVLPLTDAQREVWFAAQLGPEVSSAYNESCRLHLRGDLDVAVLKSALQEVVGRHEALRTTVNREGDGQRIAAGVEIELPVADLSDLAETEAETRAGRLIEREAQEPFDLVRGPLLRAHLVRVSGRHHLLMIAVHHVICDGWSLGVMLGEIGQLYSASCRGVAAGLPPPVQFGAYAAREAEAQRTPAFAADEAYWLAQFADGVPVLELPADRPRPVARTYAAGHRLHTLPPGVAAAVKKLGAGHQCTTFAVLLAAFNVLLHRLSGQDEIVVGVPAAAQVLGGAESLVGHCANLLPVCSRLVPEQPFGAYLDATRQKLFEVLEHWRYPFGRLVQKLNLPRHPNRVPLANVVFNATRLRGALRFEGLEAEVTGNAKRFVNFDLNFNFASTGDSLSFGCYYSAELFDDATIERLLGQYQTLLEGIAADSTTPVSALPLLEPVERRRLLRDWNDTAMDFPGECCIHQLFEAQARRTPEATALVGGRERLTYRELNERADALATRLQAAGVGPDRLVGIYLERTPLLVISLLAVLKAGGAYVPLDPAYPAERLALIAGHAQWPVLLTKRKLADRLPAGDANVVMVDDPSAEPAAAGLSPTAARATGGNLAYVIYTSGSTGRPKGVAIEHRSVVALIAWACRNYEPAELAGVLCATSVCFDVSVFELFVPLCAGGKVILADNILHVPSLPAAGEITLLSTVPSAAAELVRANYIPASVRTINLAGEALPQRLVEELYRLPHIERVFDLYGPTESTVYSTCALRQRGGRATIGRPLANEQAYILDRWRQPVPIGVAGELYLGGAGLARGYLGRPELTEEKFVANPFGPGARMYRTGDRARYRADGSIEYLGRLDHQVKLRGFRVELGEIETVLRQHPAVGECVVVVRADRPGDQQLVAYVTPDRGGRPDPGDLRRHVEQRLPAYMVPAATVVLEKLPVTPNGKVDRRALPAPGQGGTDGGGGEAAPRTTTEELLVEIWSAVLGRGSMGIHANFFELGGHSLLAAQVIARVRDGLGVELTLRQFFAAPTVAGLARAVEEALVEEIKTMSDEEASRQAGEAMLSGRS